MNPYQGPALTQTLLIYGALALFLIFRYSRPMRMSVTRMWIGPAIFLGMTGLAIWGEQMATPSPPGIIALALGAGLICGIPFGVLRGVHTKVSATNRANVMMLGPSWIVAGIWLVAFFARAGLRIAFSRSSFVMPLGDGLLAFAIAMLVASYYVIYRKYRALEHEAGQI
jgi:hypothetical protein